MSRSMRRQTAGRRLWMCFPSPRTQTVIDRDQRCRYRGRFKPSPTDDQDGFSVGHRFVGHGNREWVDEGEEYDISLGVTGRLAEDLGYDVRIGAYRWDRLETGVNKVLRSRIREEIAAGRYNVLDPFSQDADHLAAIATSRVLETTDSGSERLSARLALEGSGIAIGGRDAAWTAGVELGRFESHELLRFRSNEGMVHRVTDVLGSGGVSFAGKRETAAVFADMSLPVADRLDLRVAGRATETDDVGGLGAWRVGAEYRPPGIVTLRGSFSRGGGYALDGASVTPPRRRAIPMSCAIRAPAPRRAHARRPIRPAGGAGALGKLEARPREGREAFLRRRGAPGAVLPGRGMVPGLDLQGGREQHRHPCHPEPGGMRGRRQGELH